MVKISAWGRRISIYTLSHPEKDREVTEHAQGYMLQEHPLYVNPGVPF